MRQRMLTDGLHQILEATTIKQCVRLAEDHAAALFPHLELSLEGPAMDPTPRPDSIELRTRGRVVGQLSGRLSGTLRPEEADELEAFAGAVAVALDNARILEDHVRRARSDPLTGLLNRGEFSEMLAGLVGQKGSGPRAALGLVVLDLDRFKEINDRSGHGAGDRLLRASAAALTAACRATDAAFRIGGDEFALILPGASGAETEAVGARSAQAIQGLEGSGGVSWGAASLPSDGHTTEALLAAADAQLYARKGRPAAGVSLQIQEAERRLEVASRLAGRLTQLRTPEAIASAVVAELHSAFGYYLAVVQRRDEDGVLRVVAGAGRLAETEAGFLASEQPITSGVNGRVARTAKPALVLDTRLDPDYLTIDRGDDPGSELSTPIIVDGRVWGVLNLEQLATHAFDQSDLLLAEAVAAQTGAALHRCALVDEMENSFGTTLALLCDALENKDPYTAEHAQRVADLALQTAERVGITAEQLRAVRYCALLHDIGKLGIRGELLNKPSGLTAEEYEEVKHHSAVGAALLSRIPLLADVAPLVRGVHERWDGGGYPDGLARTEIPVEARIVAVCDAWHAMTSQRPYRSPLSQREAMTELCTNAGSQFDPEVVDAFIRGLGGGAFALGPPRAASLRS